MKSRQGRLLIHIRTLAALDMALHSPGFILAEFGLGIVIPAALSLFLLSHEKFRNPSLWNRIWAGYLFTLALNYMPLLGYAILLACRGSAHKEAAAAMAQKGKYQLQSLLLLVPFVLPALAIAQEVQSARQRRAAARVQRAASERAQDILI